MPKTIGDRIADLHATAAVSDSVRSDWAVEIVTEFQARLESIAEIVEAVTLRRAVVHGPTKTRHEITGAELRKIYRLAKGKTK